MSSASRVAWSIGLFILAFFTQTLHAQSLDDWKRALAAKQENEGCESIPYSSYRDACNRERERIKDKCGKNGEKWNCDILGTKKIRKEIEDLPKVLDEQK